MAIGLLYADFRTAELRSLEKVYFNSDSMAQFYKSFPSDTPIREIVILSTCNRVEYYYESDDVAGATEWLLRQIASYKKLDLLETQVVLQEVVEEHLIYNHLFKVVSGVESMVLGETEILGQVKKAYDIAQETGWTHAYFNKLFQTAIAIGKRVRTETEISKGSYSVTSIAIEAMKERYSNFNDKSIVILGAGTMGVRAIRKLSSIEHPNVTLVNRSMDAAKPLVEGFSLKTCSYETFFQTVFDYDIVLLATGADAYLINKVHFDEMTTPTLVIDLGIPRNANPDLMAVPDLELLSVYGLREIANRTLSGRREALADIDLIIDEELTKFRQWQVYRQEICQTQSV